MTVSEKILWKEIRNNTLGVKFSRQMPLVFGNYRYIVDFYSAQKKLIIEIDGEIHDIQGMKDYDIAREDILKTASYKVIRFKNHDITHDLENVLIEIKNYIEDE